MAIDTRPMIRAIAADAARGIAAAGIARRFQTTLVEILAATCRRLGERTGIESVALSGGVFMNALLAAETAAALLGRGLARLSASSGATGRWRLVSGPVGHRGRQTARQPATWAGPPVQLSTAWIEKGPTHVSRHTRSGDRNLRRERDANGRVDFGGVFKQVCLAHTPDAQPGQFVIVHVGFALQVIDQEEAELVFKFLNEMNELGDLKLGQDWRGRHPVASDESMEL